MRRGAPPPRPPANKPKGKAASNGAAESDDPNWIEKFTADKVAYYYNTSTESVSWDKPNSLKTADEKERDQGEWVWVSDPKEAWLPAMVKSRSGDSVTVVLENGSKKTVTAGPNEPLWHVKKSSLTHLVDDMVMVDMLNVGQMIHLLKARYNQDQIYTWVGASHSVLVSINPFKQLPIYTVNTMADFAQSSPNRLDPPHTFAIANSAFYYMRSEGTNQAILISGESGAGKTEATKQCFNFLAEIAGSEMAVEQKILNANPLLEAFGNAKTLRNNNSSRFGRWTEINFSDRGQIIGASIENYLLEKSRVVHQNHGERNYHIFYQLCDCMSGPLRLKSASSYRYLSSSGCTTADGIDDRAEFKDVKKAFQKLDFSSRDVDWIFEVCAGILHMSNITFKANGEGSMIDPSSNEAVKNTSHFLKISEATLTAALCARTIEVRGEVNLIHNNAKEAQEAADAVAKAIYDKLFNWLVQRINASVNGDKGSFIGVLDIFGFEIFDHNGFEQLCINFTNEKLQQHFNAHTFKDEEETYIAEEIPYEPVVFIDNQPVLDLIEKKPHGILIMLDEEVIVPKGSDQQWLTKSSQYQKDHANWSVPTGIKGGTASTFYVHHYAGKVSYESKGLCEKNKDSLFRNLYDMMSTATHSNFGILFPPKDKNPRRVDTLAGGFRKQLNNLMTVCATTQPHYIRCIKPNSLKKARNFDTPMCLEQLTYAGVFEAVQIRKTGYPFRLTHGRFASRYRPLLKTKDARISLIGKDDDMLSVCRAILSSVPQDFSQVAVGLTMILYRAEEHRILELLRNLCMDRIMPVAQRQVRHYIGYSYRQCLIRVRNICREALEDGNDVDLFDEAIENSRTALAPFRDLFPDYVPHDLTRAINRRHRLEERQALNIEFKALQRMDCLVHFDRFAAAVARSDAIPDMPGTPEEQKIEKRARDKLALSAKDKIEPWAEEALDVLDRNQMTMVCAEAKKYSYKSDTIEDIEDLLELPEDKFVRKQLKRANEIGDRDRVINREIKLRDIFLNMYGSMFTFDSQTCSVLLGPKDWASRKSIFSLNKSKVAMGMLEHTLEPIHHPLTNKITNPAQAKTAKKAFKDMMGYMGDRKYQYRDTLAIEILNVGMDGDDNIRVELYVQLMKQLTKNPENSSIEMGWNLLALMLIYFAPPATVDNFVAYFINKNAPPSDKNRLKVSLQMSSYGVQPQILRPTADDLPNLLTQYHAKEVDDKFLDDDVIRVSPVGSRSNSPSAPVMKSPSAQKSAPPPLPPPPAKGSPQAVALYDYVPDDASGGDMLPMKQGEVFSVNDKTGDDWWEVTTKGGKTGWVPASYVELK
mmetsp:Transcript_4274/g.7882  ORF Transcript_4274/g.7882 Transcript_4274/m.7882 type:complete len:1324 (-) Transcript_4274:156-4127(-)